MAGSAVFSYTQSEDGKVVTLKYACTTDAAAASPELTSPTITQSGAGFVNHYSLIRGFIIGARINPDGVTPPTNLFDVELNPTDDSTIDFLGGLGDNCSSTNTTWGVPIDEVNGMAVYIPGKALTVKASNAANSKLFTLEIDVALD